MAQLRQDYQQFVDRQTEVLVVGPEDAESFTVHWQKESFPFVGLPDPDHTVANLYGQQVKLLKLGRLPAMAVIDRNGVIQSLHYGSSMRDIPKNVSVLTLLDSLNQSVAAG